MKVIFIFILFCIIGYLWEVILYIFKTGKIVNKGNLHGPWLPVYGFGGLIIYYVSSKISNSFLTGFVINFIFCGFIEYFISFFEEKIWNNRWWDYSNKFLNINGRICLLSLTFFGLMGSLLSLYAVNYIDKFYNFVNNVIVVNVFVLFVIDLLYSLYKPNVGEYISIYSSNN
ncbi:MAG: putative ABC transporter permease [Bacilli bacterium]|nr:putative ABC transporter permease [Bacilli bacterium]